MHRWISFLFGMAAYAFGMGSLVLFILFVGGWTKLPGGVELPWRIDALEHGPIGLALLVNFGLVALFGIQHSVMARPGFKRAWTRIIPQAIERSCYCVATAVVICLLVCFWQPLAGTVWSFENPLLRVTLTSLQISGWVLVVASSFMINHFELFGLQQTYYRFVNKQEPEPTFTVRYFYRFVRHPLQLGVLIGIWATPHMSTSHMLLSAMMTAYILVGLYFEERDLVDTLGQKYEQYRSRVPMLWPLPKGRTRIVDLAMIALVVHLALDSGLNEAHAQGTHVWNDPTGGVWGTFTDWTPAGFPAPLDTARFNLNTQYTVSFIESRTARLLQVLDGDVTFRGAGIFPGARTLALEDALINTNGELLLTPGSSNHGMILSTSDDMTVRGALSVYDGAKLDNNSVLVDSAQSNASARLLVSGVEASGDPSRWDALSLVVGNTDNGAVRVEEGGEAFIDGLVTLGSAAGSDGEIVVTGLSSGVRSDFRAPGGIFIGDEGRGLLHVENGGFVATGGSVLGQEPGSRGDVIIEGANGTARATWNAGILNAKRGDVAVNRGGSLTTTGATIGSSAASMVTVSGAGATGDAGRWVASGATSIGNSADGTLNILQGGHVDAENVYVGRAGGVGRINVSSSNPELDSRWIQTGDLYLGGDEFGPGGVGHLNLNTNSFARIDGTTTIYAGSSVVMGPNSQLLAPTIDNSGGGFFDFLRGRLNTRNFTGDLVNQEGTLAPYQTTSLSGEGIGITTIEGNYTQQAGATLAIEMDGQICGIGYDHLNVTGDVTLGGDLVLTLLDDFVPDPFSNFTIVAADNLGDQFDNAAPGERLATTDGLGSFVVNYGASSPFIADNVVLSDFQSIAGYPGDFDGDDDVDGGDFLLWQRNDGSPGGLADWEMNYGTIAPAITASSQSVPEPSTLLLFGIASVAWVAVWRRVRRPSLASTSPTGSERGGRGSAASIAGVARLLVLLVASLAGNRLAHAQDVHEWNDSTGGVYSTFTKWTPVGFPAPADTARFNLDANYRIAFIESRTAAALQIDDGLVTFDGSGIFGVGDRTYTLGVAAVSHGAELVLERVNADRDINLDIASKIDVIGTLTILDSSTVASSSSIVDSISSSFTALVKVEGTDGGTERSTWDVDDLTVGSADRGRLAINDGGFVTSETATIGKSTGGFGDVQVRGLSANGLDNSVWVSNSPTMPMVIGERGRGLLTIEEGGLVTSQNVEMGKLLGGVGEVTVSGAASNGELSTWSTRDLTVGVGSNGGGRGILNIEEGGQVTSNGNAVIGFGSAVVQGKSSSGINSRWTTGDLTVGDIESTASLSMMQDGRLVSQNTFLGERTAGDGTISLAGQPNQISQWFNTADVYVGGSTTASAGTGLLSIQTNSRADILGTLKVWGSGRVELTGGNLQANQIDHTEGGQFDFTGGTLQFNRFDGNLVHQAGVLTPGPGADDMIIDGDYTQQTNAILQIEIGGVAPGISHDLVDVNGDVVLNGDLLLSLTGGFQPTPTNSFSILAADSVVTGQFDNVAPGDRLETTDGAGSFIVNYGSSSLFNPRQIFLTDFQSSTFFPGDYDGDDDVDGGDFLLWQRNDGSPGGLADWEMNYGTIAPAITASSQAVPEPSSILMLGLGAFGMVMVRRRGQYKNQRKQDCPPGRRSRRPGQRRFGRSFSFPCQGDRSLTEPPLLVSMVVRSPFSKILRFP